MSFLGSPRGNNLPPQQQKQQKQQHSDFNQNINQPQMNYGQYNAPAMGNYQDEPNEYEDGVPANLVPCGNCGRNFAADRLAKHMKICQKVGTKQRKVFDSIKARTQGTELASFQRMKKPDPPKPKNNWRSKHGKGRLIESHCFYMSLQIISINQPINQPTNQPTHPIIQSINQSPN